MKRIIIILLIGTHLSMHAQKKTYFVDLGMNHSGFEGKSALFPKGNTFKNYNPNMAFGVGVEIALGKRFCLLSSLGWRITGSKYIDSIRTIKYPYKRVIRTETNYTYIQQINIPILLGFNFGNKTHIKPFIGINNNYNYLYYHHYQSSGYDKVGKGYYNKYIIYGMAGIIIERKKL